MVSWLGQTTQTLARPGRWKGNISTAINIAAGPELLGAIATMLSHCRCWSNLLARRLDCRRPCQRSMTVGCKTPVCSHTTWRLPLSSCETRIVHVPEQQGEPFRSHEQLVCSGHVSTCLQSTSFPSFQPVLDLDTARSRKIDSRIQYSGWVSASRYVG